MTDYQIRKAIKKQCNYLHHNQKIVCVDMTNNTFEINFADGTISLPFPKKLIRDIKLKQLLT